MGPLRRSIWALGAVALAALGWGLWIEVLSRSAIPWSGPSDTVTWSAPVPGLKLHVFETGEMRVPAWSTWVGGSGERLMDQPAYLIEHPSRGLFLFEAGHHPDIARNPGEHLGWIHAAGLMPMTQTPGQDIRSQLQRAGFNPAELRGVVVSHFHPEHVGAVEDLPDAEIIADAMEIRHGLEHPNYNYVRAEYDQVRRWRPLSFAGTAAFGPFGGSLDLLGDGSLVIVSTPGHTPGHVSLALNLPEGPVLLSGDVAWTEKNLETRSIGLPFVSSDGPAARRALGRLLSFIATNPRVTVVPGHDLGPLRRASRPDVVLH